MCCDYLRAASETFLAKKLLHEIPVCNSKSQCRTGQRGTAQRACASIAEASRVRIDWNETNSTSHATDLARGAPEIGGQVDGELFTRSETGFEVKILPAALQVVCNGNE